MEKTKIIAGGGLVLNDAGELLMIYRRGKWDLPKGKLDEGETIEECAVREVEEETGVTGIERGALISIGYHEYFDTYLKEDVIKETHWYAMKVRGEQSLVPQTEEDITEIGWVKGAELEKCLTDSYPNVVEVVRKAGL
jgi:8-oxo-dGTP pyrophosphatase MutT (NUDIX family)